MLRWLIRTSASVSKKNKCISASDASSRAAKEAVRKFDYAKRERDMQKQINYLAEGMSKLAEAVEKNSNTIPPLAELSVYAAVLTESMETGLDAQTKDIMGKISPIITAQNQGMMKMLKSIVKYEEWLVKSHTAIIKNNETMIKILKHLDTSKPKKKK